MEDGREIARRRLGDIYQGAIEAAVANNTDPDDPNRGELVAGATIFFRRLGAGPFEDLVTELARSSVISIAEQEFADLFEKRGLPAHATRQESEWEEFLQEYLDSRRDLFTGPVQQTTRTEVMSVVNDVMTDEEFRLAGIDRIADEMNDRIEGITRTRAEVTARTEVISGSNRASQVTAERFQSEQQVGMVKEWITAQDGRVRGTDPSDKFDHVSADGQIVPLKKPFRVSGELLMHPGDVSRGASAGNVIQCRGTQASLFRQDVDESDILMT
jgi:hypothetical protein